MVEEYVTTHKGKRSVPLWSQQHKLLLARKLPHSRVKIVGGKKVIKRVFPKGGGIKDKSKTWYKWRRLINMEPDELKRFLKTSEGRSAGLSRDEARKLGIKSGRESAGWILRMQPKGKTFESALDNWSPEMWRWAKRQNSFNSRMRGNPGPLFRDGVKTRKHTSLLIWGHNPRRKLRKVRIPKLRRDGHWQRYWMVKGKKSKNPIAEIFLVKPEYMGGRKLTKEEQQKIFEERRAKDSPELTFVRHEEPEKMFIGKPKGRPLQVLRTLVHEDIHDMASDIAGKKGSRWIDAVTVPTFLNKSTGEVLNPDTAKTLAIQDERGKYQNPIDVALKEMMPTVPIRYLSRRMRTSAARRKSIIEKMKLESKYPRLEGIAKLDRIAERMKITENAGDMRKLQKDMGRTMRKYDLGTDIKNIL